MPEGLLDELLDGPVGAGNGRGEILAEDHLVTRRIAARDEGLELDLRLGGIALRRRELDLVARELGLELREIGLERRSRPDGDAELIEVRTRRLDLLPCHLDRRERPTVLVVRLPRFLDDGLLLGRLADLGRLAIEAGRAVGGDAGDQRLEDGIRRGAVERVAHDRHGRRRVRGRLDLVVHLLQRELRVRIGRRVDRGLGGRRILDAGLERRVLTDPAEVRRLELHLHVREHARERIVRRGACGRGVGTGRIERGRAVEGHAGRLLGGDAALAADVEEGERGRRGCRRAARRGLRGLRRRRRGAGRRRGRGGRRRRDRGLRQGDGAAEREHHREEPTETAERESVHGSPCRAFSDGRWP